jgi:phosphatidylethanolamine/phosphatidyl-N-methylethanolamine N-methyltransferase
MQRTTQVDEKANAMTRGRYARIAPFYDFMEIVPEARYRSWRERFWQGVDRTLPPGGRLLEVGVGTGKNLPYWPRGADVTAVDLTPGMVKRARQRGEKLGLEAEIRIGDVQSLDLPVNNFDAAAATFVFRSVPDPVLGLKELHRVVRPGGAVLLMEHVRAEPPLLGRSMDLLNPIVVRVMGANINRETVGNVVKSGLWVEEVEDLGMGGIFKIIWARVPGRGREGEH